MNNKIYYIIAATFFMLALLSGCKTITPMEATKSAGDETRLLISEHVTDEVRAKQMITLIDQLEKDLLAYADIQAAHNEKIHMKNADYDTTSADFEAYINQLITAHEKGQKHILDTRSAMKNLMTREEWTEVFRLKDD